MAKKKRRESRTEKNKSIKPLPPVDSKDPAPTNLNIVKTQLDIARHFGKTVRTVQHWIQDGMPVLPEGQYDLEKIEQWIKTREFERKKSPDAELNREDARFRRARADKMEMELAQQLGKLISREEVERGWVMRVVTVKKALLSLPKTLGPQVAGADVKTATAIIDKRIREVIENFAKGKN